MVRDVAYSSGFVSIKMAELLDSEKVERMIYAHDITDTLLVLLECGYDSTILRQNPIDINLLIEKELSNTVAFFDEFCTDQNLRLVCLKRFDYHNAKALLKEKFSLKTNQKAVYKVGLLDLDAIRQALQTNEYETLHKPMAKALTEIDQTEQVKSREIDVILDKAMFLDTSNQSKWISSSIIRQYFATSADFCNLMIAMRCRLRGFSAENTLEQFVEGGSIKTDSLLVLHSGNTNEILREFLESKYLDTVEQIIKVLENKLQLDQVENSMAEKLFDISQVGKLNTFTDEPLFAWYIQKLEELKTIRLIAICKLNNIGIDEIAMRLRGVYAK